MKKHTLIYNCKRCKTGKRIEYDIQGPYGFYRKDEAGNIIQAGVWINQTGGGKPTVYGGDPAGICQKCGKAMTYGLLEAHYIETVKCDSRCTGARGHVCNCSCGGANHGSGN